MQEQRAKRFVFRGNAMPFGGRIESIDEKIYLQSITGPPSAALTVAGGHSAARSRGSKYLDAFEWGATVATCTGELRPNGHTVTTIGCSLERFRATNLPFQFTAHLLHLEVVSDHPPSGEPSITPTKVYFGGKNNLMLDNDPLQVVTNTTLEDCPTYESLERRYREGGDFFRSQMRTFGKNPDECSPGEPLIPAENGYVHTSIVDRIIWRGQVIEGHSLYLKGFGRLHFGEVLINRNNRRITMFRLEMGSYMRAEVAGVEADPNGTW